MPYHMYYSIVVLQYPGSKTFGPNGIKCSNIISGILAEIKIFHGNEQFPWYLWRIVGWKKIFKFNKCLDFDRLLHRLYMWECSI